ncbi:hypothetical protein N656DRAFT_466036 [Canariomyces notabilis]|uniref:Uncharacterized protein n=1 Tax=Canariomyces notabilis TaxID=2074819 RepID=A0AAN6QDU6_9PEZI|nr:hypothetical protein N656DRAFT_466036 [Canariomyces arenarius]
MDLACLSTSPLYVLYSTVHSSPLLDHDVATEVEPQANDESSRVFRDPRLTSTHLAMFLRAPQHAHTYINTKNPSLGVVFSGGRRRAESQYPLRICRADLVTSPGTWSERMKPRP